MIKAESFIEQARELGFGLYTGVPCSYLKPFINYVIDSKALTYVGAANEGDAVAIASGADLGGKRAVVMFQNSGFGNAVNPLTSLNMIFQIPVLVITTLRGEPGGASDEPQHKLMGAITTGLFDLMKIRWEYFPTEESEVAGCLDRAVRHMNDTQTPYGLVMRKDSVAPHKLQTKAEKKSHAMGALPAQIAATSELPTRDALLRAVQSGNKKTDAIVATTGFTGRELYAIDDRENQLYMVGSMGCASTFGLGLAISQPKRRVIVLDGDGAVLMRLGALATLGYERPTNLLHIVLDNETHDSTGGQSTVSHSIDFAEIAHACGYPKVLRASTAAELEAIVAQDTRELTFVHCKMGGKTSDTLPRPTVTPEQVATRMRAWLKTHRADGAAE